MQECSRCDRALPAKHFPPCRRICRSCYTLQVAACHAKSGYKPPRATLHQIRVWRILTQMRTDAASSPLFACSAWPTVSTRQVSKILSETGEEGKGVALLPLPPPAEACCCCFDFSAANLCLVSLDHRRCLLRCTTAQAYAAVMSRRDALSRLATGAEPSW